MSHQGLDERLNAWRPFEGENVFEIFSAARNGDSIVTKSLLVGILLAPLPFITDHYFLPTRQHRISSGLLLVWPDLRGIEDVVTTIAQLAIPTGRLARLMSSRFYSIIFEYLGDLLWPTVEKIGSNAVHVGSLRGRWFPAQREDLSHQFGAWDRTSGILSQYLDSSLNQSMKLS